jgi:integrase
MFATWVYQDPDQVKLKGAAKASYYVGWRDPDGKMRCKSYGAGKAGKDKAEKQATILRDQLEHGTYKATSRKSWAEFREEFERRIADGMRPSTRRLAIEAVDVFQKLIKPKRMAAIKTQTIDDFIAERRKENGRHKGDLVSPATVNRQLRHLKAALRIAHEWGYLSAVPKVRMLKESGKLVVYVTPEHFAAIYRKCDVADLPRVQGYTVADWWRGLLVTCYMTGWRIGAVLALKKEDLDLDAGEAISWADDNKGKRDVRMKLHPVIVQHLKKLVGFGTFVFPWTHGDRQLYTEFAAIQAVAGVHLPCPKKHEHSAGCHVYGFHDLRRAFATMNANRLTGDALQHLMQHKSYTTTQRYINMARQVDEAVAALHVPDVLKAQA